MFKRLFLVLFLLLIGFSAAQAQPRVVSTILPIHSLTASIMNGVADDRDRFTCIGWTDNYTVSIE